MQNILLCAQSEVSLGTRISQIAISDLSMRPSEVMHPMDKERIHSIVQMMLHKGLASCSRHRQICIPCSIRAQALVTEVDLELEMKIFRTSF